MALPFLPGNSFDKNVGKARFHKSHYFDYNNDVAALSGTNKPGIGGDRLPGQVYPAEYSSIPKGEGGCLPTWVAYDKQVLSFDAYFKESVVESRKEQYRTHKVKIYFYLEDDTIQVIEPRSRNSGMPQGTILKRHRIPMPAPNDNKFYTVEAFNIGNEINLYSRVYKLVDADDFTKNFLIKLGVRVGQPCAVPDDPYTIARKAQDETMRPLRPYERHDTLGQFLSHDRHVLRFYCFWDDRDNLYGDAREMVLHYFLSDDTIEILETLRPNCGRDAAPLFLRRQKLPKNIEALRLPGEVCERTVLNVFGSLGPSGRYIIDNLKMGEVKIEFYTDQDLAIGKVVNVYGRKFLVIDCDAFTKEYYSKKYGVSEFSAIRPALQAQRAVGKEIPPYNGFGSEEDSLGNCFHYANLKPPRRDFVRLLEHDKDILRFMARMVSDKPIDQTRRVIISYLLADDNIIIFEPGQPGIPACKFLERRRVKKPNQPRYPVTVSDYYTAEDFFVGAELEIESFIFRVIDADEFAYRYLEQNPAKFPHADLARVRAKISKLTTGKLQEVRSYLARNDPDDTGFVRFEQLGNLLEHLGTNGAGKGAGSNSVGAFSVHELITLARAYSDRSDEKLDAMEVAASAQHSLRRANFDDFEGLKIAFDQIDKDRSGRMSPSDVLRVVHSVHVPIENDLVNALISLYSKEGGAVSHRELFAALDWRSRPVSMSTRQLKKLEVKTLGSQLQEDPFAALTSPGLRVDAVNYRALLLDLYGQEALKA